MVGLVAGWGGSGGWLDDLEIRPILSPLDLVLGVAIYNYVKYMSPKHISKLL